MKMQPRGRILIVGAGGLGVPAATAIARRERRLAVTIIDPDPVELSNLARQVIYRESDIGKPKAECAARYLVAEFPGMTVEGRPIALEPANAETLARSHDFIVDATDDPVSKFLINDTAIITGRPFVYGGVLGMTGQAMTVLPGRTACLRCLFEEPPDPAEVASCREAGIVGPVAGAIGEAQASEAIAFLSGAHPMLAGRMLTYDGAGAVRFRTTELPARSGCRCGAWVGRAAAAPVDQ